MRKLSPVIDLQLRLKNLPNQNKNPQKDIYQGNEHITFENRHPIYKTLLKLEFEEAIREYMKNQNIK
jgi:hypothetical protein